MLWSLDGPESVSSGHSHPGRVRMLRIDERIPFAWNDDGGDVEQSGAVAGNTVIAQRDAQQAVRFGIPAFRRRVNDAARIVHIVRP